MGEERESAEELGQGNALSYITVEPNDSDGSVPSSKCLLNIYTNSEHGFSWVYILLCVNS